MQQYVSQAGVSQAGPECAAAPVRLEPLLTPLGALPLCCRHRLLSRLPTAEDGPDASRVAVHYERFLEVGLPLRTLKLLHCAVGWLQCGLPRACTVPSLLVVCLRQQLRHCWCCLAEGPQAVARCKPPLTAGLQPWDNLLALLPPAAPQLRDVFCVKEFLRGW